MNNLEEIIKSSFRILLAKFFFSTAGLFLFGILFIVVMISAIFGSGDDEKISLKGGGKGFSDSVLQWKDDIEEEVMKQGMDKEITQVMLGILQQESGGSIKNTNGDIFQASESKCGKIGCITDPKDSIEQAVSYFKRVLDVSDNDIKVAIQSYNFGDGFAAYAKRHNDGEYSKEIAIDFSKMMMTKVPDPENYTCLRKEAKKYDACYGDILYVDSVTQYIDSKGGNSEEVGKGDISDHQGEFDMPLESVTVTSEFGPRDLHGNGNVQQHNGIDLACTEGVTKVFAASDGEVIRTAYSDSLGIHVLIKHHDGVYTGYAHLHEKLVQEGEVEQGEAIGVCGATGEGITGPHLHFSFQNAEFTTPGRKNYNPRGFLDFGERVD